MPRQVAPHTWVTTSSWKNCISNNPGSKYFITGIQFTCKARLCPTSWLLTQFIKACTTCNLQTAKETDFGRILCFEEEEKSWQLLRSREQLLDPSLLCTSTLALYQHTANNDLFEHLIKHFPTSLALLLPLEKAKNFLFHLFCLHMFQKVIPNQSSSLYTVSSITSDLPQLVGRHPKFYMEMCESILLASEYSKLLLPLKKPVLLNHTFQDLRNLIR